MHTRVLTVLSAAATRTRSNCTALRRAAWPPGRAVSDGILDRGRPTSEALVDDVGGQGQRRVVIGEAGIDDSGNMSGRLSMALRRVFVTPFSNL